jgi:hypothetical protein
MDADEALELIPIPLDTIHAGYAELSRLVHTALRTQQGDAARLGERRRDCLHMLQLALQVLVYPHFQTGSLANYYYVLKHSANIPANEYAIIRTSLHHMINCLDNASQLSSDPPDSPFAPTSTLVHTGLRGRPHIEINEDLLAVALDLHGPTHLAPIFNCHPRTICRWALELGLVEPGEPVYVDYEHEDGSIIRIFRSLTGAVSELPDVELYHIMSYILDAFPSFGRRMIDGHLKYLGHRIPCSWLEASYARVHGALTLTFGPRRIQRRVYSVPGPNSLWHHDGQHGKSQPHIFSCPTLIGLIPGLIRWKIVFHGFIDGFSHFVTSI